MEMTSTSPPIYPAEYYYPEFIDSRLDDPRISPPSLPPLSPSVTATKPNGQPKKQKKNLAIDVVTDQGLPDADITAALKIDPKKSLLRDPLENNIPKLVVNQNVIKQAARTPTFPITNLDDNQNTYNGYINGNFYKPTEPFNKQQHHVVQFVGNEQTVNDYWQQQAWMNDERTAAIEPVKYDKTKYEGPFGLTRQASLIFYLGLSIVTILAALFLIMTGVFYSQGYPDSSQKTAELGGIGACAFVFYFGLLLILIGLWQQKYRQENPVIKNTTVDNEASEQIKSSVEQNQQYDYSYQQPIDYTSSYEYYSNPPYTSNVSEQMLLQQPGAATGAVDYDPVLWPSNIEIETLPDPKFNQSMELSLGSQQSKKLLTTPKPAHTSLSDIPNNRMGKKRKHTPTKTVVSQPPKVEFDNLNLNSNDIDQHLPVLPKAPETTELIKTIAQMEQNPRHTPTTTDTSSRKKNRVQPIDAKTDISSLTDRDRDHDRDQDDHQHHRHRRHHHHRHHSHDHSPHRSHRNHHHSHRRHHHHHYREPSPCSECTYYSHNSHRHHTHAHRDHIHAHQHGHYHSVALPRIITPHLPKIITPSPQKTNTAMFRDTGVNTGGETKIMRDSSVTADLEGVPDIIENPLEKIPIVRRTIIVEPYPAQPTSQIIVKPRADMIGKIRLGQNTQLNGPNETIVYPSTAFMKKKSKTKKKKTTVVNNNIIEDLHLEDVNDDDISIKKNKLSTGKTIKNAFYN